MFLKRKVQIRHIVRRCIKIIECIYYCTAYKITRSILEFSAHVKCCILIALIFLLFALLEIPAFETVYLRKIITENRQELVHLMRLNDSLYLICKRFRKIIFIGSVLVDKYLIWNLFWFVLSSGIYFILFAFKYKFMLNSNACFKLPMRFVFIFKLF